MEAISMNAKPEDIDAYLAGVPEAPQATLQEMRRRVKAIVPDAVETISYGMPAFRYRGRPLVYFGAWKNHCALYGTSRGTIQFPLDEPLAEDVLRELMEERVRAFDGARGASKGGKSGGGD
jgi:uncharacterized protein YdhG (YjbR/CyaY superfamily)